MKIFYASIVAFFLAVPRAAVAETWQLWLEIFDEDRGTTLCKYRTDSGQYEVTEHSGYHLCPRVACLSPDQEAQLTPDGNCAGSEPLPLS